MRVVVDTNIFVSAALKGSSWPGPVVRWIAAFGGLLKSTATEAQVIEVLQRPYFMPRVSNGFRRDLTAILARAETIAITERIAVCRDPTDDKFLELAVNGKANVLVTGDLDLLVLHPFRGIPIVTPQSFGNARAQEA
jgi:putative PIN family toxin of toxin-antitoxin system